MVLHLGAERQLKKALTVVNDTGIFNKSTLELSLQHFPRCACVEDVGIGQGGNIMNTHLCINSAA